MRHFTIEMLGHDRDGDFVCMVSAPPWGVSHEPQGAYDRRLVLNDGTHRVIVGLYNGVTLPIETIKRIAREVVEKYA